MSTTILYCGLSDRFRLGTNLVPHGHLIFRDNTEKWMELCAQAANETDSRKLMALIQQITALLDAKQEPLIEKDSRPFRSERTD